MRLPPFNPYLAVAIGVIAVSSTAVLVKLAGNAPAGIIANYRLLFAVILIVPLIFTKYRHEFKYLNKKDWIFTVFAGLFLALHFVLWFDSFNYTSVVSSVVLVTLQPIFAFIGTYLFFKERFSFAAVVSLIIAIFGSLIIGYGDYQISGLALFGDILAILGAIAVTAYFLFGRQVRKKTSYITYTFIVYGVSSIALVIYNLFMQNAFIGYSQSQWWVFIALALIPTFLGHSVFNWAFKWLSTSTISFAFVLEPVVATILAVLIIREQITATQLLGGTVVIFGLLLFSVATSRKRTVTMSTNLPKK